MEGKWPLSFHGPATVMLGTLGPYPDGRVELAQRNFVSGRYILHFFNFVRSKQSIQVLNNLEFLCYNFTEACYELRDI